MLKIVNLTFTILIPVQASVKYTAGQFLSIDKKLHCSITSSEIWGLVG